ncbi:MAG: hypothetical protein D3924_11650, partial [Candidatus Electrothrix sp. AR4]|nr:hypothetical protein [Candidatus Electrothrix sp. AR4]
MLDTLHASSIETLPCVIQSLLTEENDDRTEKDTIRRLAETLSDNTDVDFWAAILTGLGLATLERRVAQFISILQQHGIKRAQWSFASMIADDSLDLSSFSTFEQLKNLCDAVAEFRALPKKSLRAACLNVLPT